MAIESTANRVAVLGLVLVVVALGACTNQRTDQESGVDDSDVPRQFELPSREIGEEQLLGSDPRGQELRYTCAGLFDIRADDLEQRFTAATAEPVELFGVLGLQPNDWVLLRRCHQHRKQNQRSMWSLSTPR